VLNNLDVRSSRYSYRYPYYRNYSAYQKYYGSDEKKPAKTVEEENKPSPLIPHSNIYGHFRRFAAHLPLPGFSNRMSRRVLRSRMTATCAIKRILVGDSSRLPEPLLPDDVNTDPARGTQPVGSMACEGRALSRSPTADQ
jgi:hypothetical protein